MKQTLLLCLTLILCFSCASKKESSIYFHDGVPRSCNYSNNKKGFKRIVDDKFLSIIENDTVLLNEIRYECTNTAFKLSEAIYHEHGKWDEFIVPSNKYSPLLVWNNLKLIPGDSTAYTVISSGEEDWNMMYSSLMVFHEGNDVLGKHPKKTEAIKKYFSELIAEIVKTRDDEFYKVYWQTRNPDLKFRKKPVHMVKNRSQFLETFETDH